MATSRHDTTTAGGARALLETLLDRARAAGADAADAVCAAGRALSVSRRLGRLETVERAEARDLGLRVFVGRRQALVSSTDTAAALTTLAERAVAMARAAPEDPWCGLASADQLAHDWKSLDLDDNTEPPPAELEERAAEAEDAARAVPGVTNSEGAEASWSRMRLTLATSGGFQGGYVTSRHAVSCAVLAGSGGGMERDYDHATAHHLAGLEPARNIGQRAGERAVRRLNPRKTQSRRMTVVYDPRVSHTLLRHLSNAISGDAVARGASFLKDKMHARVFAPGVRITDDPVRLRGLGSRPFDGEGVRGAGRILVDDGLLASWLLDSASARQLGLDSTGHAARGPGTLPAPAPTNLFMQPGLLPPDRLMDGIGTGLYVTELIGAGVSTLNGNYSRGAAGFLIEDGVLTHPVSEVTVAGNLNDMFAHLAPADDLAFRYTVNAPTLRVERMTVAGA